jgi:hypothetical protein
MRARQPELDFTKSLPVWTKNQEFCQLFNAFSVIIMELEPFMNRVMRKAKDALDDGDPLREDIATFIRQEANHTLLHRAYNQALYEAGYDQLKDIESLLAEEYRRFLEEKPLLELVAYCEGFESLGPILAELAFEELDDIFAGGDQDVIDLWKWHLAEEYEHRNVAFDVYHSLGGSWLHRLKSTYTTLRHLGKFRRIIHRHIILTDQQRMTVVQKKISQESARRLNKRLRKFFIKRGLRILSPFYSPKKLGLPVGAEQYLDAY